MNRESPDVHSTVSKTQYPSYKHWRNPKPRHQILIYIYISTVETLNPLATNISHTSPSDPLNPSHNTNLQINPHTKQRTTDTKPIIYIKAD